jgi:hypothetical protein
MIEQTDAGTVITGEHIALYQMLALRSALRLEVKGLRFGAGRSPYAAAKRLFGFTGSKASVLAQLQAKIDEDFPKPESSDA